MAFNEKALPGLMARVACALDTEGAATGLYDLARKIGAPTALKDIGMKEENIDEAVPPILEATPEDNPRPVDKAGVRQILEDALAGRRPGLVSDSS